MTLGPMLGYAEERRALLQVDAARHWALLDIDGY